MTKKEKEKKVLEALDLRVGDVIIENVWKDEYRIIEGEDRYALASCSNEHILPIIYLIIYDFEVIQYHQKTYGEYKCEDLKCCDCPLKNMVCIGKAKMTLYEILDNSKDYNEDYNEDYSYFKSKLDKVVEDENEILN